MSRDKPLLRAIKLLSLIERNANGLRVADIAEQLGAPPRAVYRDLDVLQQLEVPLYTDKNGRESFWKLDPDYRNRLSIPFTLSELLSVYFAQDSIRPLEGTVLYDSLQALFEKVWPRNKKLKDGSLELTFEVAGIKEIKTWIFGFGSLAEVLEPAPLVKESQRRLGEVTESLRRGKTSKDR